MYAYVYIYSHMCIHVYSKDAGLTPGVIVRPNFQKEQGKLRQLIVKSKGKEPSK